MKQRRRWAVLVFFLALINGRSAVKGQLQGDPTFNPELKALVAHTNWTVRDGAPSNITALAQTTDGYLWIGTSLGLYRFDGMQFIGYPGTPLETPLPSVDIEALSSDGLGGLWIGYNFGGISHLAANGVISNYNQKNGLGPNSAQKFIVRTDGSVWAIADNRVFHLQGSHWEDYGSAHGLPPGQFFALLFDSKGNLWTSTRKRIFVLRRGESQFALYPTETKMVVDMAEMPDGRLWLSDGWNFVRPLEPAANSAPIKINGYVRIVVEPNGMLWMAQDYRGVSYLPFGGAAAGHVQKVPEISSEQTNAIFRDAAGNIWVGTSRGLDRFRVSPIQTLAGVRLEYYPALASDPLSGVWIGDLAHPLLHARGSDIHVVSPSVGSSPMVCDAEGVVWLVDPIQNALTRYSRTGVRRIPITAETNAGAAQSIGFDPDGKILVSFDEAGLWRYDGQWSRLVDPALPEIGPLSVYRDKQRRVWFGYSNGAIVMQDEHGYHSMPPTSEENIGNVLTFASVAGRTWAAGAAGVAYFHQGSFHHISIKHGDLLKGVSGVTGDRSGDVWLNASAGILRIRAADIERAVLRNEPVEVVLLNDRQGLVGTATQLKPTPSAVSDQEGNLWFSTSGAVFAIDPKKISTQQTSPSVQVEGVSVDGKPYRDREHWTRELKFSSLGLKDLEISYAGIDLSTPEQVSYRYILEGEDKDWHDVGGRKQATYNHLSPGTYTFRIQATSGQGKWVELAAPVSFVVTPVFYERGWFYALAVVLIVALLYGAYLWRVHLVTNRLRERLRERTEERVRIARELHDTLLQSVHGLMLRFHFATESLPQEEPARASLRLALSRADDVLLEGRRRVQDLREELPEVTDFATQIANLAEEMQIRTVMAFNVSENGFRRPLAPGVLVELFRITKEALTNSMQHSEAESAEVLLTYGLKEFVLECRDTGKGVPPSVLADGRYAGHWGLVGMRERATLIRGHLELWSSPGNGTRVTVRVPSRGAYKTGRRRLQWLNSLLHPIKVSGDRDAAADADRKRL